MWMEMEKNFLSFVDWFVFVSLVHSHLLRYLQMGICVHLSIYIFTYEQIRSSHHHIFLSLSITIYIIIIMCHKISNEIVSTFIKCKNDLNKFTKFTWPIRILEFRKSARRDKKESTHWRIFHIWRFSLCHFHHNHTKSPNI